MTAAAPAPDRLAGLPGLLPLLWLASPALPVGGFSYSEGLEAAIDGGWVRDESTVADWLSHQLALTQSRGELAVVAAALRAWRSDDLPHARALNDWVLQTRESRELRLQTEQMGRSLLDWLRQRLGDDAAGNARLRALQSTPPTWPIAFALAAAPTRATESDVLMAFAFGWAENMVQAAIKAVPLGQSAGQRILDRLIRDIPAAVARALATGDDERQAFSPMLAILSARHEHQYSRLFRS